MMEIPRARPGFVAAVLRVFRNYADFEGRASRPEFWWYALFHALILSLCDVFAVVRLAPEVSVGSIAAGVFTIVTLVPFLAVAVRRLRDADLGWGHLLWLLVPVGGIVILGFYLARPTARDEGGEPARWTL